MFFHDARERRCYRAWVHYGRHGRLSSSIEVSWLRTFCQIGFGFDDDQGWGISLALPPVALWLHIGVPRALQLERDREVKISIHSWAIWWTIWRDWKDGWSHDVPKWREGSFHILDFLLGRAKCSHRDIEEREIAIPMPEKAYPAKAKLQEWTWKRPRWFARTINRVTIDIPEGVPFPGKGENSWDCGDDATFGVTTGECNSIPEAVGDLVGSTLQRRIRYGGWKDWRWVRQDARVEVCLIEHP